MQAICMRRLAQVDTVLQKLNNKLKILYFQTSRLLCPRSKCMSNIVKQSKKESVYFLPMIINRSFFSVTETLEDIVRSLSYRKLQKTKKAIRQPQRYKQRTFRQQTILSKEFPVIGASQSVHLKLRFFEKADEHEKTLLSSRLEVSRALKASVRREPRLLPTGVSPGPLGLLLGSPRSGWQTPFN